MQSPYEVLDRRFVDLIAGSALLETLYTGAGFTEGPVYFGDHRCLIFSDVPGNKLLRYDEETRQTSVFRSPSNYANGNTRDRQGRLVSCEHRTRRVARTELDGSITVIADNWHGKRLNSPNDVVVKSDGTVWFTDPTYGISQYWQGGKAESEIDGCNVFRCDPRDGSLEVAVDDFVRPNGLAFSPDERTLYIVDSGITNFSDGPHHIRAFDVDEGGKLANSRVLVDVAPGVPDGFRVDEAGNLWCSAGDGVHCYSPEGELIGKILTPQLCGNVEFGGPLLNRLYICGYTALYSVVLNVCGIPKV